MSDSDQTNLLRGTDAARTAEPLPEGTDVQRQVETSVSGIRQETLGSLIAIAQAKKMATHDGQEIEYIDLEPQGKPADIPVMVVGGVAETGHSFIPMQVQLSRGGRRALSVCTMHGIDVKPMRGVPTPLHRIAASIVALAREKGITQMDAIGHSMGAPLISIVDKLQPGLLRSAVFYNPAAMMEGESLFRIAGRTVKDAMLQSGKHKKLDREGKREGFLKEYDRYTADIGDKYVRGGALSLRRLGHHLSSVRLSLGEIFSVSRRHMLDDVRAMQERGVNVGVVTTQEDVLFPLQLSRLSKRASIPAENIVRPPGTHRAHLLDSEGITTEIQKLLERISHGPGKKAA